MKAKVTNRIELTIETVHGCYLEIKTNFSR